MTDTHTGGVRKVNGQKPLMNDVRLLVLGMGDPRNVGTFSGIPHHLLRELDAVGATHHTANALGWADPFASPTLLRRLQRKADRFGWTERYLWSSFAYRGHSRRARKIAASNPGYNACLLIGTMFDPELDADTYCFLDATVEQVLRVNAWAFNHLPEHVARHCRKKQQEIFDRSAGIFTLSRWCAESVTNDYGIDPGKVVVCGAGPNLAQAPHPHGPYDGQTILFVGRDFQRKGGVLLLEAFRRVRTQLPKAKLVIVGCNPPVDEAGVEVVGMIRKDDVSGYDRLLRHYSEASVFVMLSDFEPFGIVVLEAQSCAVPCVVPKRFAFPETVVDGVTGRLVDCNVESVAGGLIELLTDPAGLARMGKAAQAHVAENYTWSIAANRIHGHIALKLRQRSKA